MSILEILLFAACLTVAVYYAYRLTGSSCRVIGHEWKRVSLWDREYQCKRCGESRG